MTERKQYIYYKGHKFIVTKFDEYRYTLYIKLEGFDLMLLRCKKCVKGRASKNVLFVLGIFDQMIDYLEKKSKKELALRQTL